MWRSQGLLTSLKFRGYSGNFEVNDYVRITGDVRYTDFRDSVGVILKKREWYPGWLVKIVQGTFRDKYVLVQEKNLILVKKALQPAMGRFKLNINIGTERQRTIFPVQTIPEYQPHQIVSDRLEKRIILRDEGTLPREITFPTSASFTMLSLDGIEISADAYLNAMSNDDIRTQSLLDEIGLEIVRNGKSHLFANVDIQKVSREFVNQSKDAQTSGSLMLALAKLSAAIEKWDGYAPAWLYANRSELCRLMSKTVDDNVDHWISQALKDADETIRRQPEWSRGYSRRGNVLASIGSLQEAIAAYDKALLLDPDNITVSTARNNMFLQLNA